MITFDEKYGTFELDGVTILILSTYWMRHPRRAKLVAEIIERLEGLTV